MLLGEMAPGQAYQAPGLHTPTWACTGDRSGTRTLVDELSVRAAVAGPLLELHSLERGHVRNQRAGHRARDEREQQRDDVHWPLVPEMATGSAILRSLLYVATYTYFLFLRSLLYRFFTARELSLLISYFRL